MERAVSTIRRQPVRSATVAAVAVLLLVLTGCGDDAMDGDDAATDTNDEPTEAVTETPAPEPTPATEPEDTPTPETDEESEPTAPEATMEADDEEEGESQPDVDLAPALAGLTDWRNSEPVTLEELRGEPVVLVFWNSI